MERLENSWEGWKAEPCSQETSEFLALLIKRLEWAQRVDSRVKEGNVYGHSGNIVEILNRADKIKVLKSTIQLINEARELKGC